MSLFTIFGSVRYPQSDHENKAEYFSLVLFATMGMMFLAKSGNLITAFIALEIFSIALYILCGFSAKHGTGRESPSDKMDLDWECQASQETIGVERLVQSHQQQKQTGCQKRQFRHGSNPSQNFGENILIINYNPINQWKGNP